MTEASYNYVAITLSKVAQTLQKLATRRSIRTGHQEAAQSGRLPNTERTRLHIEPGPWFGDPGVGPCKTRDWPTNLEISQVIWLLANYLGNLANYLGISQKRRARLQTEPGPSLLVGLL